MYTSGDSCTFINVLCFFIHILYLNLSLSLAPSLSPSFFPFHSLILLSSFTLVFFLLSPFLLPFTPFIFLPSSSLPSLSFLPSSRYLWDTLEEKASEVHIFSTFFFSRLTDATKDKNKCVI